MLTEATRLGPYEIVSAIGAGGMGEVYRARDTRLGREVAVKILPETVALDPDRRGRFEREARAVAALSHPNILAIHDYGTHEQITYAVMELLEGATLRARLNAGPVPWREAVPIAAAIGDGLAAAHARGIIHRDLKPENLFLTADGRVKILDFGLARVEAASEPLDKTVSHLPLETSPGLVMGTVGYISPEQLRGQAVDGRSDIFSFGCVLHEMLTARRAFSGNTAAETMTAILHDEPPDLEDVGRPFPVELRRIVRRCLAKNPNERYQSARDLALDLRSIAAEAPAGRRRHPAGFPSRKVAALLITVALLAAIAGGTWYAIKQKAAIPTEEIPIQALAVLPFQNVSGDPKVEYLSEGLADHLINSLSQARRQNLKVRPFNSVSRYKGKLPPLAQVGRELNVRGVLTGTLHQQGDDLTISVALVDVRDENQLWGKRYQATTAGLLKVQDQIFADIASQLRLQLTAEEQRTLAKRQPQNSQAYLLYNEGMYHMRKFTEAAQVIAIEYFQRALAEDNQYALAYVGLAQSHALIGNLYRGPRTAVPQAQKYLNQALAIDPSLAEAHAVLGSIHTWQYEWLAAEQRYKRAFELDPELPSVTTYGFYLAARGRLDEALEAFKTNASRVPQNAPVEGQLGLAYLWLRRPDQAIVHLQRALETDPNFFLAAGDLGRAYLLKGAYREAISSLERGVQLSRRHARILGLLGYGYAKVGQRAQAEAVLSELMEGADRYGYALAIAHVHAGLGQVEQAIDWLEKAAEERESGIIWVKVDETLDSLRDHPRFHRLLRQMGLAETETAQEEGFRSVAVLPFENVGADPKNEYLSDGLADHIINSLWQVRSRELKVRPFTSVARYRGQKPNLPQVARDLNVRAIITGTLHQQEENLWISVALMDATEENHLWGKRYQGTLKGILELQDQIARDVAENLRLRLTGAEEQRLTRHHTQNHEAYLLFREGMYHLNRFTPEGIALAQDRFNQALTKDPNYALAHVGLGRSFGLLGSLHVGPRQTHPTARLHVQKALAIDDTLSEAFSTLGVIYLFHDWDWPAAERALKRAIELDPQTPSRSIYGFWLAAHGRLTEALSQIQIGQAQDPLAAPRHHESAMCHLWLRQYDQAIVEARKAIELDPNFMLAQIQLALAYTQKKMHDQAIATLEKGAAGPGGARLRGVLGYALVAAGRQEEGRMVARELAAQPRFGVPLALARIYTALGQKDEAFEWLQKSAEEREPVIIWIKVDPTLEPLRSDPRFDKLVAFMGLPTEN